MFVFFDHAVTRHGLFIVNMVLSNKRDMVVFIGLQQFNDVRKKFNDIRRTYGDRFHLLRSIYN